MVLSINREKMKALYGVLVVNDINFIDAVSLLHDHFVSRHPLKEPEISEPLRLIQRSIASISILQLNPSDGIQIVIHHDIYPGHESIGIVLILRPKYLRVFFVYVTHTLSQALLVNLITSAVAFALGVLGASIHLYPILSFKIRLRYIAGIVIIEMEVLETIVVFNIYIHKCS